jgi:NAD kinase
MGWSANAMSYHPRIAVYGGTFDPPGAHHRDIASQLKDIFDEVIVLPCGPRPDRPILNDTSPIHRAVMTDLTFRGLPRVRVDLSDLENDLFTPAVEYDAVYGKDGAQVSHVITAEWVRGGARGESLVQKIWVEGHQAWQTLHFTILEPHDEPLSSADLPPKHQIVKVDSIVPPNVIRSRVFNQEPFEELVVPEVARYITRRHLFRGIPPGRESTFRPSRRRCLLIYDERNAESLKLARKLEPFVCTDCDDDPELIVALGGDGTMLHAIRQHWRKRVPFYGINTGHLGFLLNDDNDQLTEHFWETDLLLYQLPLLWAKVETIHGETLSRLAFNDAWVERASGQTAWVKLEVNGNETISKVVADGVLVASAAGSTSYAKAMGATPVPFNMPVMILAGSNVVKPPAWKPALMPIESVVKMTAIDPTKRPLQGFIDGVSQGEVKSMTVRVSNTAAVELAFCRAHDPVTKLYRMQFLQDLGSRL